MVKPTGCARTNTQASVVQLNLYRPNGAATGANKNASVCSVPGEFVQRFILCFYFLHKCEYTYILNLLCWFWVSPPLGEADQRNLHRDRERTRLRAHTDIGWDIIDGMFVCACVCMRSGFRICGRRDIQYLHTPARTHMRFNHFTFQFP